MTLARDGELLCDHYKHNNQQNCKIMLPKTLCKSTPCAERPIPECVLYLVITVHALI